MKSSNVLTLHVWAFAIAVGAAVFASQSDGAEIKPTSATEYRDAQFLTCIAGVSEATVLKNPDKAIEKCLVKAETKTAKWQERKAKSAAKLAQKAATAH